MVTAEEYIKRPTPLIWMHALDILRHVLKGDTEQTAFKDNISPNRTCLQELRKDLEEHLKYDPGFDELVERTNFRAKRRVPMWDDSGDLEVGAYIDREELCFTDYPKVDRPDTNGITITFDMFVAWKDRDGDYMIERHRKAYELAVQAEAEGVPCRVIGVVTSKIPEFSETCRCFAVIKDFNDPIFPGIWGALKTNRTTNNFINTIADFLVGTRQCGNWYPTPTFMEREFAEDEVIVLAPATNLVPGKFKTI